MDILKSLFPWSFKNKTMKDLIISILIYMAINIVGGLVFGLLSAIPLIGFVFSLLGGALGIYTLAGVILGVWLAAALTSAPSWASPPSRMGANTEYRSSGSRSRVANSSLLSLK